ncbi:uncharacterized protein BP5553_01665 [Venustampulla echinocandica]|uniref:Uncharacterized protein n=1 Tax=Venustampulla echinocandica TaxID=2656787 RepID=A0A370U1M8_9HELO|nr:uncharacterized protein BP5553_01665 [Venustampulla echinocandica]RDL41686.1 hypothetical protein BP5553_01665 [Venustampulla echinocandica]
MSLVSSNVFFLIAHDSNKDWDTEGAGFLSTFLNLTESSSNQTTNAGNSSATLSLSRISAPRTSSTSTFITTTLSTSVKAAIISTSESIRTTITSELPATITLSSTLSTLKSSISATSSQTYSPVSASSSQSTPTAVKIPREITITLAVFLSILFLSIALSFYIIYRHKKRRRYNRQVSWNAFLSRVRSVSTRSSKHKTTNSLTPDTLAPEVRSYRWTGFNRTRRKKSMYELDGTGNVPLFELP